MGYWESPKGVVASQLLRAWGLVRLYRAEGGADCQPDPQLVRLVFDPRLSDLTLPMDSQNAGGYKDGLGFASSIAMDVDRVIGSRRELERMLLWVYVGGAEVVYEHMEMDHAGGMVKEGANEHVGLRWTRSAREYRHVPDRVPLREVILLTWGSESEFWDDLAVRFARKLVRETGYEKFASRPAPRREEGAA